MGLENEQLPRCIAGAVQLDRIGETSIHWKHISSVDLVDALILELARDGGLSDLVTGRRERLHKLGLSPKAALSEQLKEGVLPHSMRIICAVFVRASRCGVFPVSEHLSARRAGTLFRSLEASKKADQSFSLVFVELQTKFVT